MNALTQYKSSAGSGKTYTLVLEYLKIVIAQPHQYRHILAITFTNKATEEMKSRIISALSELAGSDPQKLGKLPLYQQLQDYFEEKGKSQDISAQARKVLNLILSDYSNFSVSTIESFFQRIIRAFARELGLPLSYEVEMQQDLTLDRIIAQTFREVGEDQALTTLLKRFTERSMEEEKGWNLDRRIRDLGKEIFKENFQDLLVKHQDQLAEPSLEEVLALDKRLWAIRRQFETRMHELAKRAIEIMEQHQLGMDDFLHKKSGVAGYLFKVRDTQNYEPGARARQAGEASEKWYTQSSKKEAEIEAALDAGMMQCLQSIISLYDEEFVAYNSACVVLDTIYSFGLISNLQQKLVAYRREQQLLVISDTNHLLSRVVSDRDTPFVYEKVGTRYNYYLIDEFQDTSDMQWNNLRPLVWEALSAGNGSLIVGDVKQSIYRWRNGNPRLLMYQVQDELRLRGQQVNQKNLISNWRTAAEVVSFNNIFFREAARYLGDFEAFQSTELNPFERAYEEVEQKVEKEEMPGWVEVAFFPKKNEEDVHWKEQSLERSLNLIEELEAEGFQRSDITFLLRKNREGVELASYLQEHGVSVTSAESLKLGKHPQVRFLLSLLRYLNHENDDIAAAEVAYYHHFLTQHPIAEAQEAESIHHELFMGEKGPGLPEVLIENTPALRQLSVYECLEKLLRLFASLLPPNAYTEGLLDQVLEFSTQQDTSIAAFLQYWEEAGGSKAIVGGEDPNSVQLMTIHKAKGLEFPVVIMPFCDWDMKPNKESILWVEPDQAPYSDFAFLPVKSSSKLENSYFAAEYRHELLYSYLDNLNLLYVSFTRPKYRLYIMAEAGKSKSSKADQSLPISRISKLIEQVMDLELIPAQREEMESGYRWKMGRKGVPERAEKGVSHELVQAGPRPLGHWNQAIRIRYGSGRYLSADMVARNEMIKAGELLHEALSWVILPEDVPAAASRMVNKGYLPAAQQEKLEAQLRQIISQAEVKDWFSPEWEVKTEAALILPDGQVLRPDRVNLSPERVLVIDYKTGQPKDAHAYQVKAYQESLQSMGYPQVEAFLYYTESGEVVLI
jgi:ATP-dependent helicase/nuclease subunit A